MTLDTLDPLIYDYTNQVWIRADASGVYRYEDSGDESYGEAHAGEAVTDGELIRLRAFYTADRLWREGRIPTASWSATLDRVMRGDVTT